MPDIEFTVKFLDKTHIEIEGTDIEHINGRMFTLFQRKLHRAIRARRSANLFAQRKAAREAENAKEVEEVEEILADAILPEDQHPELNADVLDGDPSIGLAGGSAEEAIEDTQV